MTFSLAACKVHLISAPTLEKFLKPLARLFFSGVGCVLKKQIIMHKYLIIGGIAVAGLLLGVAVSGYINRNSATAVATNP